MQRMATCRLTLSDGSVIPADARVMVAKGTCDPAVCPDPDTFGPYGFSDREEQSMKSPQSNASQHVSVMAQHMEWGYEVHSCPGRFVASSELEIALSHLLLRYEWKREEMARHACAQFETMTTISPGCKIPMRRRYEEIVLDLRQNVDEDALRICVTVLLIRSRGPGIAHVTKTRKT